MLRLGYARSAGSTERENNSNDNGAKCKNLKDDLLCVPQVSAQNDAQKTLDADSNKIQRHELPACAPSFHFHQT